MLFDKDTDESMIERHFDHIVSCEVEDPTPASTSYNSHARAWKINRIRKDMNRLKRGRMTDDERVDILKNDLFWAVQDDKPTEKIVEALALLQECKTNDDNQETKRRNTLPSVAAGFLVYVFWVGIATVGMSYLTLPFCKNSPSRLCRTGRIVPDMLQGEGHERPYKSLVLPEN